MGRVLAPYGVQGWIKVKPFTERIEGLLAYPIWWLGWGEAWETHELIEGRVQGDALLARLAGFEQREQAAAARGKSVAVARQALPPPEDGRYYWADLIGLSVVSTSGQSYGELAEIFTTGANDVLVVRGERERLIPFIDSVVVSVDLQARRMVVDWGADYL